MVKVMKKAETPATPIKVSKGLRKRRRLIERDGLHCKKCGKKGNEGNLTIEHVIPKSQGGSNDLKNLVLLCKNCNTDLDVLRRCCKNGSLPVYHHFREICIFEDKNYNNIKHKT